MKITEYYSEQGWLSYLWRPLFQQSQIPGPCQETKHWEQAAVSLQNVWKSFSRGKAHERPYAQPCEPISSEWAIVFIPLTIILFLKCPACDMTCPTPSILATHMRYRHTTERPLACQVNLLFLPWFRRGISSNVQCTPLLVITPCKKFYISDVLPRLVFYAPARNSIYTPAWNIHSS